MHVFILNYAIKLLSQSYKCYILSPFLLPAIDQDGFQITQVLRICNDNS